MLGHLGLGTCAPKGRVQLSGVHGLLGGRYLGALFLLSCGHLPPDLGDGASFPFGHGDHGLGGRLEIGPGDALCAVLARLIGRPDRLAERYRHHLPMGFVHEFVWLA
jgi:hypothetical protein